MRARAPGSAANLGPGFDALALALRADCPIFVEEEVLRTAKVLPHPVDAPGTSAELRQWLESLGDEDLGKYKM